MKKPKLSRLAVAGILLAILASISGVYAATYVVLQWQVSITTVANPDVCFFTWIGGAKANSFPYTSNLYPNITTLGTNITKGIQNYEAAINTIYFRLASENTNSTDTLWAYIKIYNGTATLATMNETNFNAPTTTWSSAYQISASDKLTIDIQVKGAATLGAGHTATITYEMRVDE